MPAPATAADLVDVARRSGLVSTERLAALTEQLNGESAPPATADQMAQALVRVGAITRFQARQLKLGRYKRFMVAGKYKLLELLGAGGMGAVYLCEHVLMRRLVALKILPQEKLADPSNLERFHREARAVAALDHPNLVRAFDIDKFENTHFLVMEFVDGRSVQEIVALHGMMDPVRVANYIAQAAVGLQHAGELSMVHRDIKPGNVLLDRTGVVKILDMGLARFFDDKNDNLTAKYDDNCVLGTADYLAPEQAMSNVVDIRADIYALGGTMYYALTGKSPAPDGTVAQKLVFHQTQDPEPVTVVRSDVPPALLAVLTKMLKKRPAERYQTPMDVAAALAPWADRPIDSPPTTEMPDLCPAVLALTGHAGERPRARAAARKSGPGKLVRPRTGESAALLTPTPMVMSETPSGELARVELDSPTAEAHVPTGRSNATLPMHPGKPVAGGTSEVAFASPSSGTLASASGFRVPRPSPGRGVWVAVGAAVMLVLVVVAYLVSRA